MNLILIKPTERSTDTDAVDLEPNDERTKHILSHLNKTTGDTVSVGFVDSLGGCKCKAIVLQRQNGGVRLVPKPNTMHQSPGLPEITLVLAVPFPARMKYLWPVIASFAAVTRVVIVRGKLSNPEFCETKALKPSAYEQMIEKGMSQGGRTRPVKVDICLEDETISRHLLERLGLVCNTNNTDGTARIFLDCGDEYATPPPARDIVLEQCGKENDKIPSAIVAVGPERGWTDEEAKIFVDVCGFKSATLGSSILRVDTAVVSGLGIVSAALDESQQQSDREYKRKRIHSPCKGTESTNEKE
eukprot:CAMPEP_0172313054 /NCGR_PEP_ID=MMETSP1058-20130122/19230_1 /TAXON_ID=83371 /ORGANISM="Detonula confervacea, Strain CCMP 353" /LENGTH=300 /DNA_ID=CAMNT_0013026641 /DNA_START=136 /DNA_END=1038 /DNA_ORIENTATION=-